MEVSVQGFKADLSYSNKIKQSISWTKVDQTICASRTVKFSSDGAIDAVQLALVIHSVKTDGYNSRGHDLQNWNM